MGCEVYVAPNSRFDREMSHGEDRYYHLVLLAENNQGYQNLMKIVSKGFVEGYYYKPRVDMETSEQYHEGLIALSACLAGEGGRAILPERPDMTQAEKAARSHQACLWKGRNYFLELQDHGIPDQTTGQRSSHADERGAGYSSGRHQRCALYLRRRMRSPMTSCCASRPARSWSR